jgi:glutamyl-tRNA synthetase
MKTLILKYALQNAVFYGGKAETGAVLGKVLAGEPALRKRVQEVKKEIEIALKEVNSLSPEEQRKRLEGIAPELLERKERKEEGLPELPEAKMGKVVTRFAPAPSGALNISHALRAVMINYLYAKKYGGKFILRLEDTDASKVEKEYYGMIKEDLRSIGVKPDLVVIQSERMESYYRHAHHLIKEGHMFACFCPVDKFKIFVQARKPCPHQKAKPEENLKAWKDSLEGKCREGEVVFRFRTSMKEPNPALRNPAMIRISEKAHPLQGKKYRVWPLYNYANVIDDHEFGVTHVFRGKEHEHNTTIQKRVYEALGWEPPVALNFGMIYLPGEKLHKRHIKELIKEGKLSGWDDPRLPTIRSLVRRGFLPEMFRQLAINTGLSKNDIRIGWENVEGINKKFIDPIANRYMVVMEPVKISIRGGPGIKEAEEAFHPDFPERGKKKIPVREQDIWISGEDFRSLSGKEFRLKGLGNIHLRGNEGYYTGNAIVREMQKVQWVSEPHVRIRVVMPERTLEGIGEPSMAKLKSGDLIQMERIGFGRVDTADQKEVAVFFAHK